ncbi:hypothetical protein B0H13DRAFT_2525927 [Mycena leptocephala]|nr:hypothetical protein B0H13DRAFT_2525927 [Mycena leptocephala]
MTIHSVDGRRRRHPTRGICTWTTSPTMRPPSLASPNADPPLASTNARIHYRPRAFPKCKPQAVPPDPGSARLAFSRKRKRYCDWADRRKRAADESCARYDADACRVAHHVSSLAAARPRPPSQSPVPHLSATHLSTWGSSLSSRHLSHRPQAVPSNPGSAQLTSALHSETATERRKCATVRLRRGWVEARVGRATQPARGTITMCTTGAEEPRRASQELRKHAACTRYYYDVHKRRPEGGEHRLLRPVKRHDSARAPLTTPAPYTADACRPHGSSLVAASRESWRRPSPPPVYPRPLPPFPITHLHVGPSLSSSHPPPPLPPPVLRS